MWNQPMMIYVLNVYLLSLCLGFLLAVFIKRLIYAPRFVVTSKVNEVYSNFILVTGCDTGFGRALVLKLLNDGLNVIAGCFTEQVRSLSTIIVYVHCCREEQA